mgnify:CR=1 FL=1
MNKRVKKYYCVVYNNKVLAIDTGLSSFYKQVIALEIGYTYSERYLRNKFKEVKRFNISNLSSGAQYWFEEWST